MTRVCLAVALCVAVGARADEVPSEKRKAGGDEKKEYFLIGAAKDRKSPKDGFGLVVVLPGGDGSADFHPFVKRLYQNSMHDGYLAAQPIAVKWTDGQEVVWPTAGLKAEKMKFTTEEFVAAVIADVGKAHRIDPARTFTLSWSSGGPAAYAISLQEKPVVAGSFIAMSVFRPDWLPDLKAAKGHAYYLYHSPDDRVCPYRMAQQAEKDLTAAGAKVVLKTYAGGHGWRGPLYADLRAGIEWLEKNHAAPAGR